MRRELLCTSPIDRNYLIDNLQLAKNNQYARKLITRKYCSRRKTVSTGISSLLSSRKPLYPVLPVHLSVQRHPRQETVLR